MNFKAYQTENDKEWNEGTNNEKYYTKIFEDSYKESFKSYNTSDENSDNTSDENSDENSDNKTFNKTFKVHVKNEHNSGKCDHEVTINNRKLLGTITIKNKDESSIIKILERTLEEEQKYYFKYAINTDHSDQNILQELNRVTLMDFYKIFRIRDTNYGTTSNHLNKFITQFACQNQNLTIEDQAAGEPQQLAQKQLAQKVVEFMFPILILKKEQEQEEIWNVYLNPQAKPLYLDQGTDTAMYRYKLEASTYKKAINFIVCNKITYDNHTNSYYVNPPGHGAVNLTLNSSQNKDPLYLNCFPRTSFFYGFCENANSNILINSKKELQKQFGDNCYPKRNNDNAIGYTIDQYKKYINEKDIDSDFKEALWVFMEWIYEKLTKKKYKKFTELWKDLDDFLKYEETDNEDEKNEIRQLYTEALDYSQLLFDNYWCFYYEDSNGLESFLAELIFGKSGGWSGYQMRADKIDELPYVWKYRDLQKDEQHEARLLALYLGLPSDRVTKGEFVNGYKQTNVPQDKKKSLKYNSPNPEKTNMNSRFIYAKEITNKRNEKSNNNPRNCPKGQGDKSKPIDPKLPVLSSNGFKSSHHYRIKNKGKEKKGVVYKKSSEIGKRLDASTVMGKALNQYDIYKELKKQQKNDSNDYGVKISKVTNTKLPASAFAQYLLKNDKQVKANWQPDNSSQENNIILPTNQEWCHLFGHGDGGKEELGNFISGSKHCNTEQLGIEVGQRRVIQNTKKRYKYLEILEGDREKFKAKITAYSMPNQGVWKLKDKENQPLPFNGDGEQNLKTWLSSDDANEWKNKFCINGNQDTIKQNATELSKAFEELSESIKKAKDQDKEKLVMLQQHIEKNFFLLSLPLGRWMRYKIYYGEKKVFDHIYDAQSQSFDINEAKILDFTVERVLYQALADNTNGKDCYDKEYYEFLYRQKLIDRTVELVSNYGKKENGEILYKNALLSKFSEIKEINKSFYHIFKQQMLYVIKNKLYNELKDYKSVVEETITNFKGYKQTLSDEQEHSNCCVQIITGLEALLKAFDDNNSQAIVQNFEFISTKDPNK